MHYCTHSRRLVNVCSIDTREQATVSRGERPRTDDVLMGRQEFSPHLYTKRVIPCTTETCVLMPIPFVLSHISPTYRQRFPPSKQLTMRLHLTTNRNENVFSLLPRSFPETDKYLSIRHFTHIVTGMKTCAGKA